MGPETTTAEFYVASNGALKLRKVSERKGVVGESFLTRLRKAVPILGKPQRPKVGRNDSCPCMSGRKFKKCCWSKYKDE